MLVEQVFSPSCFNAIGYVRQRACFEDGLRSSPVKDVASLLRAHLARDFASLAAGDVDEGGDEDDGEAAKYVDETAFDVVAEMLLGRVRGPRPDFEEGPVGFGVVIIERRVGVVVNDDGFGLTADDAVGLAPLVAPVGGQIALEDDRMRHGGSLNLPHLATIHRRRGGRGNGCMMGEEGIMIFMIGKMLCRSNYCLGFKFLDMKLSIKRNT